MRGFTYRCERKLQHKNWNDIAKNPKESEITMIIVIGFYLKNAFQSELKVTFYELPKLHLFSLLDLRAIIVLKLLCDGKDCGSNYNAYNKLWNGYPEVKFLLIKWLRSDNAFFKGVWCWIKHRAKQKQKSISSIFFCIWSLIIVSC